MPASLMASQFATLERPGVEENPIVVDVSPPPAVILDAIIRGMA
jgi:gluconate kinase